MDGKETLIIQLDSWLYEKMEAILVPEGTTVEEVTLSFIHWCVENPELAEETLHRWQAEQNSTNDSDKGEI